ncbi:MAG: SDR family NAD(P)-dependent oxidoreductase, partial [Cyanobacteria bacterium M_surface_9_m1_291]|nr:SDR family NAD(P)-dependent oxidoreductase [Cyanobacteria bacterium M_surface_9_m1_291]
RQVLPTTPFARARCWVEEDDAARLPSPFDLERSWQPLAAPAAQPFAGELQRVTSAELEAAPVLDQAFWQRWLPRLQKALQPRQPAHWVLEADAETAGPQAQAIAALLRTWLREAGATAGALLWAGPGGRDLQQLQQAGAPPAGAEWRWNSSAGRVETAELSGAPAERFAAPVPAIQPVATYLITGGLGALGLATARWLAQRGARHLLLVARRSPSEAQATAIAEIEALGCRVDVDNLDVADPQAVRELLARIAADGRPLHGIVHAAGVLDDGLLSNQTPERCAAVAAAKLGGAVAFDAASRELAPALEFFVSYSSVAALLGSPGQASYAAANGALDGLMAQRRRDGLPGLSLNWGPWAGEGMASRAPQLLNAIQPAAALASLGRWLASGAGQGVVVDLKQTSEHRLGPRCRVLLAELDGLDAEAARLAAVQVCLADLLADLGGFAPNELKPETSIYGLGLDSLMAVELATAVQAGLGVSLGLGALSGEPTLGSLAAHLLALLGDPAAASSARVDLGAEAQLPDPLAAQLASLPQPSSPRPPDTVLLTGATGFLGAFLLADQLRRHPQLNVWCLVRADGAGAAKARVRANLQHYDLWDDDFGARIVGLP